MLAFHEIIPWQHVLTPHNSIFNDTVITLLILIHFERKFIFIHEHNIILLNYELDWIYVDISIFLCGFIHRSDVNTTIFNFII